MRGYVKHEGKQNSTMEYVLSNTYKTHTTYFSHMYCGSIIFPILDGNNICSSTLSVGAINGSWVLLRCTEADSKVIVSWEKNNILYPTRCRRRCIVRGTTCLDHPTDYSKLLWSIAISHIIMVDYSITSFNKYSQLSWI